MTTNYATPTNLSHGRAPLWRLEDTGRYLIRVRLGLDPGKHEGRLVDLGEAEKLLKIYQAHLPEGEAAFYWGWLEASRTGQMRLMI